MKALVCEVCGSNDVIKQDGYFVCQYCGTKYTVEEARKILGTVKIDKTEETEKLLTLARRAREDNNYENAEKYYGMALQDDPNNWEVAFFQIYYHSMQCKIANISGALYSVSNSIDSTMKLISTVEDREEKDNAIKTVITYSEQIASLLANAAIDYYNDTQKNNSQVQFDLLNECIERVAAAYGIYTKLEESMKKYFSEEEDILLSLLKSANSFISSSTKYTNYKYRKSENARLTSEIRDKDPTYNPPEVNGGGCYVATAVYGSYDCPQVWTLRRYRDFELARTWYGRAFIHTYYAISPTIVKWFGNTEWFKKMWRGTLDKMVSRLNADGYEDTPYNDRNW